MVMSEPDYKRAYYCLKKWVEEIQVEPVTHQDAVSWIVNTCEAEIFNGTYLGDDEYSEILLGYK